MNFTGVAFKVVGHKLFLLDQTQLPLREEWLEMTDLEVMVESIQALKVRGAPAISLSAGIFLALWSKDKSYKEIKSAADKLLASRPTAINLSNVLNELVYQANQDEVVHKILVEKAMGFIHEDVKICDRLGELGAELVNVGDGILTHCNTGGLAVAGKGTALSVIFHAHELHKNIHVFIDETRPLLQGGRLTAWEIERAGISHSLICDNMAAYFMSLGKIQKIFVGADRIARNGDFANKIGTYGLAVLAKYHNVPFYCVAPSTTIDHECENGSKIPIEERSSQEVKGFASKLGQLMWAPENVQVKNPAFDVTPAELVTGLITEKGTYNASSLSQGDHLQ